MFIFASFLYYIMRVLGYFILASLFSVRTNKSEGGRMNTLESIKKKKKIQETKHEYFISLKRIREVFTKCLSNAKVNNTIYSNSLPAPSLKVCESSHVCSSDFIKFNRSEEMV